MTTNTELIASFPEINPANYTDDDVNALNAWGISAHSAIEALEAEREQLQRDFTYMKQRRDDLQAEVGRLKSELSTTDVLLEECKMDWSGDVTQIKAEHKHEIDDLQAQLAAAQGQAEDQRKYKDGAYLERNRLVALLSKVFPSGKKKTAIEGWSGDWHGCIYIDLPTGQASWHYHDSQAWLFEHLPEYQGTWDGHTTDEKYERIQGYAAPIPQQVAEPKLCKPCRDTGLLHCSDPENCGGPWTTPAPQPKEKQ